MLQTLHRTSCCSILPEFNFYPVNHSVARAEYGYPCVPYELLVAEPGFFSGFQPVDAVLSEPPSWSFRVNDTDPIFYYCSAPGSCLAFAMVGVVNPNANVSLARHAQLALEAKFMLQPGQSAQQVRLTHISVQLILNTGEEWPDDGERPSTSTSFPTPTVTSNPTNTVAPSTPASSHDPHSETSASKSHSLSPGAIAGIAIGGLAVFLAAGTAIWFCGRHSRRTTHITPTLAPPGYLQSACPVQTYASPETKQYPSMAVEQYSPRPPSVAGSQPLLFDPCASSPPVYNVPTAGMLQAHDATHEMSASNDNVGRLTRDDADRFSSSNRG